MFAFRLPFQQSREVLLSYFQIDAFTERVFGGNPAGVCALEQWLPDALLQRIALENNLSETAFVVANGDEFDLRWMTPTVEVDLCGHATLAAAFVLFNYLGFANGDAIRFRTKAGPLGASRDEDNRIVLDLPAWPPKPAAIPTELVDALGWIPRELHRTRDYLAVFSSEDEISALKPDFRKLAALDCFGVICTAPGSDCDFVSRFFAPAAGVPEDPATGSAHCTLTPYWAKRLDKTHLRARQLSARGGTFWCENRGERVGIGGQCALYGRASLQIPDVME